MARTSKRYLKECVVAPNAQIKKFTAAIYTRISHERTETHRKPTNSLDNQIDICQKYAKENGIYILKAYSDYEYSGTNFERPGFQEMLDDIRTRKINCVLVKDLSRFGRDYLEMGNYIEKVFPFLGIRFISVNDELDTEKGVDDKKNFEVALKNIINEMYARDISAKIKATKAVKREQGLICGGPAIYGYKKVNVEGGQKYIVDEKVRHIVEKIFELRASGVSKRLIALELNKLNISTPKDYRITGDIYRQNSEYREWSDSTVEKLLIKEVYIGHTVQGMKINNTVKILNTHEAIISEEVYFKIQKMYEVSAEISNKIEFRKDIPASVGDKYKGILYCEQCGRVLKRINTLSSDKTKRYYRYNCSQMQGKTNDFKHITVSEAIIDQLVVKSIKEIMLSNLNKNELTDDAQKQTDTILKLNSKNIVKYKKKANDCDYNIQKAYEKYVEGKHTKEVFLEYKQKIYTEKDSYINEVEIFEAREKEIIKIHKEYNKWLMTLFKINFDSEFDNEILSLLIDKIYVSKDKEIKIIFKFNHFTDSLNEVI